MPKMSKESAANVEEFGPGKEWSEDLDGYKASMVATSGGGMFPKLADLDG